MKHCLTTVVFYLIFFANVANACLLGTCGAGTYCGILLLCLACQDCPAGQYASVACTDGSDRTCASCAYGKFTTTANLASCQAWKVCGGGTYLTTQGTYTSDVQCGTCSAGTFTNTSNALACTQCAPGTYGSSAGMSTCANCQLGRYNPSSAATTCTPCGAGKYGGTTGLLTCTDCADGTYAATQGYSACATCSNCASGTYITANCTRTSNTGCTSCAAGRFSNTVNSPSCTDCSTCGAGRYRTATCTTSLDTQCGTCSTCAAGRYVTQNCTSLTNRQCTNCPAGQFSVTTNVPSCTQCDVCSAGRFSSTVCTSTTNTVCSGCSQCPPGKYIAQPCTPTQDTICVDCAAGTYSNTTDATSCSACATCAAGKYASVPCGTQDRVCTDCASETYSVSANVESCTVCTQCRTDQQEESACMATADRTCSGCPSCPAGQYINECPDQISNCVACDTCDPPNTWTAANCSSLNTLCPPCSPCAVGTYFGGLCTLYADTNCLACPSDTFSDTLNATACTPCSSCPIGKYISAPCNSSSDTVCTDCTSCSAGTFTFANCSTNADTICKTCASCENGTYLASACDEWQDSVCNACSYCTPGTYLEAPCTNLTDTICPACVDGENFTTGINAPACTACSSCGDGQYESIACSASSNVVCAECEYCAPGYFTRALCNQTHATDCPACPPGTYSSFPDLSNCSACTVCDQEASPCTQTSDSICFYPELPELVVDIIAPKTISFSSTLILQPFIHPFTTIPGANYLWNFQWYHFDYSGAQDTLPPASLAQRVLTVNPGFLTIADHRFTLIVTITRIDLASRPTESYVTAAQLTVISNNLVAFIIGGDRIVNPSNSFSLDASPSSNLDNPSEPLSFYWTCVKAQDFSNVTLPGVSLTDPVLTVPASLVGDMVGSYLFTVYVLSQSGLRANYTVTITVQTTSRSLSVLITVPNAPYLPIFNEGSEIALLATLIPSDVVTKYLWSWEILNGPIGFLDNTSNILSTPKTPSLKIKANLLPAAGSPYQFRMYVVSNSDPSVFGLSTLSVTVNAAPSGGSCSVTPPVGVTLVTFFNLSCINWQDDSGQALSYAFSYKVGGTSNLVTRGSYSPYSSVLLPVGIITFSVQISDAYGAVTTYSFGQVEVNSKNSSGPLGDQLPNCAIATQQEIALAAASQDNDALLQVITVIIKHLLQNESSYNASCNSTLVSYDAFRQGIWLQFLQIIKDVASQSTSRGEAVAKQLASVLLTLTDGLFNPNAVTQQVALSPEDQQQSIVLIIETLQILTSQVVSDQLLRDTVINVYSNLLGVVNCSEVNTITSLIALLAMSSGETQIPDTQFVRFVATRVSSEVFTTYVNQNLLLNTGGLEFNFTQEMFQSQNDSEYVQIVVSRYKLNDTIARCRPAGNSSQIKGDIVTIDITVHGKTIKVTNLSEPFNFTLPISAPSEPTSPCSQKEVLFCGWWNNETESWETSGCESLGIVQTSEGPALLCSCVHLTDFTALAKLEARTNDECNPTSSSLVLSYLILAGIYVVVGVVSVIQFFRVLHLTLFKQNKMLRAVKCYNPLVAEHGFIFVVCVFRCLTRLHLGHLYEFGLYVFALLLAIPYTLNFWMFTQLVFEWANLIHLPMKDLQLGKRRLFSLFLICNIIVSALILSVFVSLVLGWETDSVLFIASLGMTIIYSVTGITFVIYGTLLSRQMARVIGNRASAGSRSVSSSVGEHIYTCSLAGRLGLGSWIVSLCFVVESAIWTLSVLKSDQDELFDTLFSSFDISAMIGILILFWGSISRLISEVKDAEDEGVSPMTIGNSRHTLDDSSAEAKDILRSPSWQKGRHPSGVPSMSLTRAPSTPAAIAHHRPQASTSPSTASLSSGSGSSGADPEVEMTPAAISPRDITTIPEVIPSTPA